MEVFTKVFLKSTLEDETVFLVGEEVIVTYNKKEILSFICTNFSKGAQHYQQCLKDKNQRFFIVLISKMITNLMFDMPVDDILIKKHDFVDFLTLFYLIQYQTLPGCL